MKNKLSILLITSLSLTLSACGAKTEPAEAQLPAESESEFYEGTLEILPSFEILQKEITLECGVPFNMDDLSQYIKADNYDNIEMSVYETSRLGEPIEAEYWSESYWDTMGREPQVFEITFSDSVSHYEDTMIVTYKDTLAPIITLKEGCSDEIIFYQLYYDTLQDKIISHTEKLDVISAAANYNSTNLSDLPSLVEHDHSFIKYFKSVNIIYNDKIIEDINDNNTIINEFPTPGSYTINLAFTDWGNNTGTYPFTLHIIEDITPKEKEDISKNQYLPEDKYQQLYNDYLAGKE